MDETSVHLRRIEAMVKALLQLNRPTMRFHEVREMLGVKTDNAARLWLKRNGLDGKGARYDRAAVIAAQLNR